MSQGDRGLLGDGRAVTRKWRREPEPKHYWHYNEHRAISTAPGEYTPLPPGLKVVPLHVPGMQDYQPPLSGYQYDAIQSFQTQSLQQQSFRQAARRYEIGDG